MLTAALLVLALTIACTTQPPPAAPEDEFAPEGEPGLRHSGTDIVLISFHAAELSFRFRLHNPTSATLQLTQTEYELSSNSSLLDAGTHAPEAATVPPGQSLSFDIPVRIPLPAPRPGSSSVPQDIPYRMSLSVTAATSVGDAPLQMNAAAEGAIDLPRLPELKITRVVIPQFETTTIRLQYEITAVNPNPFAVSLSPVDYVFSVEDTTWDSATLPRALHLPPGEERSMAVPMKVNYLQAGRHTVDILVGAKNLDYRLQGTADVHPARQKAGDRNTSEAGFSFSFDTAGTAAIIRP
jgi:LEA14-like dessication related protein